MFLVTTAALGVSLVAGCTAGVQQNPSAAAHAAVQTSYLVRASQATTTVLHLRSGDELVIPAGALKAGSTVSAMYGSPPAGSWNGTQPVSLPVHFIVTPAQRFRKALLLDSYLGNESDLDAAGFGYYRVSTLDTRTHRWIEVPSSYDPATQTLATELWHFSWWSTVQNAQTVAKIAAKCLTESVAADVGQAARTFLQCLLKEGLTELNSAVETRILSALLPKSCWGALQIDAAVASIAGVLYGMMTEPACVGGAGSDGISAPTVSKVSPASGPGGGGTKVTITGWMFAMASSVTFGGRRAPSFSIPLNSNDTITAIAPAGAPGTIDVRVADGGGISPVTRADRFTYTTPSATPSPSPSPSSASPGTGSGSGTGTWTAVTPVSVPADADSNNNAGLNSVSCPSTTYCVAVGDYLYDGGQNAGMVLTGPPASMTAAQAQAPGNAMSDPEMTLSGVSCASPSFCVAVGEYEAAVPAGQQSYQRMGLLLTWSGGSWVPTQAPLPGDAATGSSSGADVNLNSVSCASASYCVAVGQYQAGNINAPQPQGLLLTWSGDTGQWTPAVAPWVSDGSAPSVDYVSCPSVSNCVATGSDYTHVVILTDSAGSWTLAEAPLPTGITAGAGDGGVSCWSVSNCVAVGRAETSGGGAVGMLLTDAGGSWTADEAPAPANAEGGEEPVNVSCSSASACVATGGYRDNVDHAWGYLLTESAGSWTAAQAPVPSDAMADNPVEGLSGISCPAVTACVAVGGYDTSLTSSRALVLTESG